MTNRRTHCNGRITGRGAPMLRWPAAGCRRTGRTARGGQSDQGQHRCRVAVPVLDGCIGPRCGHRQPRLSGREAERRWPARPGQRTAAPVTPLDHTGSARDGGTPARRRAGPPPRGPAPVPGTRTPCRAARTAATRPPGPTIDCHRRYSGAEPPGSSPCVSRPTRGRGCGSSKSRSCGSLNNPCAASMRTRRRRGPTRSAGCLQVTADRLVVVGRQGTRLPRAWDGYDRAQ